MAAPAITRDFGLPPVPVLDLDEMLSRMPATVRTSVAWAKPLIDTALARLQTQPLTDELLADVADEIGPPLSSVTTAFWAMVGASPDEWRARLIDDFKLEDRELAAFVADESSRDTLAWIFGLLQSLLVVALSISPAFVTRIDERMLAEASADGDLAPYRRTLVALMAASNERKRGGDVARARELVDMAFLQLHAFKATLRKHGVAISPFPSESLDERHARLAETCERLRKTLSDTDWKTLDEARLRALR